MSSPKLSITLPDGKEHILYAPTPAQLAFHQSAVPKLCAIGNRGGGKSMMLRWDAHMRALSVPGCSLILIRKTYPQLLQSHLIHLPQEMKLLGGTYHHSNHIAHYPNGSRLFLSYVSSEVDSFNQLSAEYLAAYFDELSTISWEYFTKIIASVRVTKLADAVGSHLVASVRAATNPLGPSADEVRRYFVDKEVSPEEDDQYIPEDWGFVKVQMEDNPYIDRKQYIKNFAGMPSHVKKAWLEGEFANEAQLFDFWPKKDDKPYHVINELPTMNGKPIIRYEW